MKKLPQITFPLLLIIVVLFCAIFAVLYLTKYLQSRALAKPLFNPVVAEGTAWEAPFSENIAIASSQASDSPKDKEVQINLLLLGLDGRLGDKKPRCDAIHFLSLDKKNEEISVTTIPRGTVLDLEIDGQPAKTYLGNACHLLGIEKTVKEMEKLAGLKADYVVKLGFSQTLGLLKTLNLPAPDTLQKLRNRAYGIGDYQRSYNQAVFIKDLLLRFEEFEKLPNIVKYLGFQMIETDLEYEQALAIIRDFPFTKLKNNPEKIKLAAKPGNKYKTQDIHIMPNYAQQSSLPVSSDSDFQRQLEEKLSALIVKADNLLKANNTARAFNLISVPFNQQIWRQIEDNTKSSHYYYQLLRLYIFSNPDKVESPSLIMDYILAMESQNQDKLARMGKQLLETQEK